MFPFCLNKKNSIPFLLLWFCVFSPGVATVTGLYWEDAGARPRPASDGVWAAAAPVPAASRAPQLPRAPHEELQAQSVLREHPRKTIHIHRIAEIYSETTRQLRVKKNWKLTETLGNGYSSESAQRELSNEYQHDRVWMFLHGGTSVQKIIHVYFITHARPDSMHFAWLFYMI